MNFKRKKTNSKQCNTILNLSIYKTGT